MPSVPPIALPTYIVCVLLWKVAQRSKRQSTLTTFASAQVAQPLTIAEVTVGTLLYLPATQHVTTVPACMISAAQVLSTLRRAAVLSGPGSRRRRLQLLAALMRRCDAKPGPTRPELRFLVRT